MLYDDVHSRRDNVTRYDVYNLVEISLRALFPLRTSRLDFYVKELSPCYFYSISWCTKICKPCYKTLCVFLRKNRPVTWQTSLLMVRSLRLQDLGTFITIKHSLKHYKNSIFIHLLQPLRIISILLLIINKNTLLSINKQLLLRNGIKDEIIFIILFKTLFLI